MDAAADGVEGYGVVRGVRCEDCDCGAGGEGVDGGFVGFWVALVVGGEGGEVGGKVVVDVCYVGLEVLSWVLLVPV